MKHAKPPSWWLQLWLLTFLLLIKDIFSRNNLGQLISLSIFFISVIWKKMYLIWAPLDLTHECSLQCLWCPLITGRSPAAEMTDVTGRSLAAEMTDTVVMSLFSTLSSRALPRSDYRSASPWALAATWWIWNNICLWSWPWGGFPSEQWPGSLLCQLYSTVLQCPIFCVSMDMAVIDVCFLSSESKGHFLQYALQDCGLGPSCGGHESDKISLFWSLFHRSLILPNKPRDTNNLSQSPFPCQGKKKPSWQIVFPSKHLGARDEHPLDLGVTVGIWTHICLWWAPWWASSRRPPRHFAWDSDWLISSWFRI